MRPSPGSPSSAKVGARFALVANLALPRPPRPPLATTASSPSCTRSANTSPVSASLTRVPAGTFMMQCGAFLPY